MKKLTRRETLVASTSAIAGAMVAKNALAQSDHDHHHGHDMRGSHKGQMKTPPPPQTSTAKYAHPRGNDWYARTIDPDDTVPPGEPGRDYNPVVMPNGETMPFKIVDGAKVFHITASEFTHEFAPGFKATCWGYNGRVPGPVIEAVEGDQIRIYVTNKLPVATAVHWHGLVLPMGMDGVSGLTQRPIKPGEIFRFEFKLVQHGTFMYHAHKDVMTQEGMGLIGMFVVHPRKPKKPRPDRDFSLMLHEMDIKPGTHRPDTSVSSGFNTLTINGRVFPGTAPLVTKLGDRTRIRIGNLSAMDHHPFHIHGHAFRVTETDGGEVPEAAQWPETSALVAVGQTRNLEFVTDNPGDWAVHCHMTHHTMNQMGHGLPNMVGVNPTILDKTVGSLIPGYMTMGQDGMGEMGKHAEHMDLPENSIPMVGKQGPYSYMGMGGMFTVLKVRKDIMNYDDPGWYQPPKGTSARPATAAELQKDGITT